MYKFLTSKRTTSFRFQAEVFFLLRSSVCSVLPLCVHSLTHSTGRTDGWMDACCIGPYSLPACLPVRHSCADTVRDRYRKGREGRGWMDVSTESRHAMRARKLTHWDGMVVHSSARRGLGRSFGPRSLRSFMMNV